MLIPYKEYVKKEYLHTTEILENEFVPSEVVDLMLDENFTILRAWREYLNLTQKEVADKLNISQSAYAQYELKEKLTKKARIKLAKALGIHQEQLDC